MRRRIVVSLSLLLAAGLCVPAAAPAHGLVGKADLPVPKGLFALAAAVVLVISFLGLAGLWQRARLEQPVERPLFRIPLGVDVAAGVLGVVLFAVVVYAGLAGTSSTRANLAPTAIFIGFWVGIPFLSLLFGDIWRALSPWRAVGRLCGWSAKQLGSVPEPLAYPARLGVWPAVLGLVAFGWIELVWTRNDEPAALAVVALAYCVVQLVGMAVYGVEAWTRRADVFELYFGLFARLSPLVRRDGVLHRRRPLAGLADDAPPAGWVTFLTSAIGVTAFDGLQAGQPFSDAVGWGQDRLVDLGLSLGDALTLAFTIGLLLCVVGVNLVYRAGVAGIGRPSASTAFAHTLVPIAAGYVVAHYFSLLAYDGQGLAYLASDPLGEGSDLFGTASIQIDYGWITATVIWYVQIVALLAGHVAGLVLAHDRALALTGSAKAATRSQIVMLAVMVAFTLFGLWLLSESL